MPMAKKRASKKTETPPVINNNAEFEYCYATTFQILDLKARYFSLAQTMVSLARELGVNPSIVKTKIETVHRAELQRLLEVAEDMNPGLAAYLDERKIEDL